MTAEVSMFQCPHADVDCPVCKRSSAARDLKDLRERLDVMAVLLELTIQERDRARHDLESLRQENVSMNVQINRMRERMADCAGTAASLSTILRKSSESISRR